MANCPVFWISGNYYEARKAWQSLCQCVGDPLIEVLDSDSVNASDIVMRLKCSDMFDDRPRIVRVNGLPSDYDVLTKYLTLASDDNILVFYGPVGYWSNRRFVSVKNTKFYKAIADIKSPPAARRLLHFNNEFSTEREALEWIDKVAVENKKTIDLESSKILIGLKGLNIDVLYSEVVRLCDYQTRKQITPTDIEDCCVPLNVKTAWDFVDSLLAMQYELAVSYLEKFYESTEAEKKLRSEAQALIGAIVYTLTFLLFVKSKAAISPSDAKLALADVYKITREDGEISTKPLFDAYYITKALNKPSMKSALSWNSKKIFHVLDCANKCRTQMKIHSEESLIKTSFNTLLMVACDKMDRKVQESIVCW